MPSNFLAVCKIRVFKVDNFALPLFLATKLKSGAQTEWKKHNFFSTFGSKTNEFERKKNRNKQKNPKA